MKKNLYLFITALLSLFAMQASAEAYAIWCNGNTTFYFVSSTKNYVAGGTYDGQSITDVWKGSDVTQTPSAWEGVVWSSSIQNTVTRVVFDDSFKEVKVKTTANWFNYCGELQSIEGLKNLNTANVTDMSSMFLACGSLTSLDVSNFNTANVTNMNNMFCACYGLTSLDVSNFNTTNVTNMSGMFYQCEGLTSLDVSKFNTAKVTDMSAMFIGCRSLTNLDVSNFNTAKVTTMRSLFCYCSGLTSLDLSNFNTANVTDMADMFFDCSQLKTIIVGDGWNLNSLTDSDYMFGNCSDIVGGKGTAYDENFTDAKYARIDGGPNNPGYLSDNTANVNKVILNKSEVIVRKGKTVTLKATVYPETLADKSVKWKSSDKTIATVSSSGKVTGVKSGVVTITCTSVSTGAKATCKVTVGTITLNKKEVIVRKKKSVTLKPTVYPTTLEDKSVKWKSSDKTIATVSSSGKVTGVKSGVVTITCTSNATGLSTTCKVTVGTITLNKSEVIVRKKKTVTLTPTVYPTSLEDKSVTWKSSDESVATVSSDGVVTGIKSGVITITCTSNATGLSATCKVTVATIALNKSSATITVGNTLTLKPTVYPTTLEDQSVTWKSSNKAVATVKNGKVTGVAAGTATITCTSVATGVSTTCKVTVTASASARTIDGDDDELTDIEIVEVTPATEEPFDVYDLRGHRVLHQVTSLDALPAGVYIVNGKKVMKK